MKQITVQIDIFQFHQIKNEYFVWKNIVQKYLNKFASFLFNCIK